MVNSATNGFKQNGAFIDRMEGGAFIFSADDSHRLLYANDKLVRLFECKNAEELYEHVNSCFDGMVHDPSPQIINNEIADQIKNSTNGSGYVFYNIMTKTGNVRRVVNHWTLVHDDDYGDIFYATVYLHKLDNASNDYDSLTGLLNKNRFGRFATERNRKCCAYGDKTRLAMIYFNLVHFKLLNLERGTNEGNICLKEVARVLGGTFEESYISRLSSDHFAVFTQGDTAVENTKKAVRMFKESHGNTHNISCKMGIYIFEPGEDFYVETALSYAKIACDSIKRNEKKDYAEYTKELADQVRTTEYVVSRIDDAIKNEWIKVYFQPVVRSITGDACSMESLARWIDPEIGFLPPDKFIGALEREKCIHKLDCFIVEKVCEVIGKRLKERLPVVPVSVNFSRLDFVMCDMLAVVEDAVSRHSVPREYIHIEITESMIASDEDLMRKVINDFRDSGYEIWMDDFGSGYSSLTLLKEYDFNTVKLDMRFLTPLTEKSKSIIKSVVTMAKDIGMKTLAEGVETEEQLEFLKEIGCGHIQGYYYGKPEPIEDVFRHLDENGIKNEKIEWSRFYQAAGFNARATEIPLEIIEDDGQNFRTLFMNQAYRDQIFSEELSIEDIDAIIYKTGAPLMKKFREFADILELSKKKETFFFTVGGSYLSLTGMEIAEHNGHHILQGTLFNLSKDEKSDDRKRLDDMLKEMNLLFESVQAVNLGENTIVPLLGGFKYLDRDAVDGKDLQKAITFFSEKMVHPDETKRCLDFLESASLAERIKNTKLGYIADIFRIKRESGYIPCEAYIMMIPGTQENEFLFCVKECVASHE